MIRTTKVDLRDIAVGGDDRIAVVADSTVVTYADLDLAASKVANGLRGLGLGEGARVAYLGKNCVASVELMLGAPRAGVVLTLLNWRLHPQELRHVLIDSCAAVLVVTSEYVDLLEALCQGSEGLHVIIVGGESDQWRPWCEQQTAESERAPRPTDDVAIQLYTSGTTGFPKGAMLTYSGIAATMADTAQLWQTNESSVVLLALPLFHIIGIASVLVALTSGSTLVLSNDASLAGIRTAVARHGVTNVVLVTTILEALADSPTEDFATMRTISYGGSPISQEVLRRLGATLDCRFVQIYGLTETVGGLTALLPEDHAASADDLVQEVRLRSCGRARPGVELRIVDPDSGQVLPAGHIGEVQARTDRLMRGYWHQPEATAAAFADDGWFRTGDLGELDGDGYLFLRDRLKDMIVSGAENIYPVEVEMVLLSHPEVAEAAVVGIPHQRWGETPLAVIVRQPGSSMSEEDLLTFVRDNLAHYKCPTAVRFVSTLPRNATGKVLRRVLREPFWVAHQRRVN